MQLYVRIEEMVEKLTEVNLKPERKAEQMTSTSPWSGEVLLLLDKLSSDNRPRVLAPLATRIFLFRVHLALTQKLELQRRDTFVSFRGDIKL